MAPAGSGRPDGAGERFDRLPVDGDERTVADRPTRAEVLAYFADRFGIESALDPYTFWERGAGKIWVCRGTEPSPATVEALGMTLLRTRREYWKPTMAAVQKFGGHATENVLELDREAAGRFLAGEEQPVAWDGDWGYLIVSHELAGDTEPLGVGLYTHDTLRSQVPKSRRREL